MSKTCQHCSRDLDLSMFSRCSARKDGLQKWCKECTREYKRDYRVKNKERIAESNRAYMRRSEIALRTKQNRARYRSNPDVKMREAETQRIRRESLRASAEYRVNHRMSNYMNRSLRSGKAGRSWRSLVGYDLAALMRRIESQFQSGMSWENYGEWHIDHIIPKSWFYYESTEDWQFKVCWSLANLQPLWASENHAKGNRWRS